MIILWHGEKEYRLPKDTFEYPYASWLDHNSLLSGAQLPVVVFTPRFLSDNMQMLLKATGWENPLYCFYDEPTFDNVLERFRGEWGGEEEDTLLLEGGSIARSVFHKFSLPTSDHDFFLLGKDVEHTSISTDEVPLGDLMGISSFDRSPFVEGQLFSSVQYEILRAPRGFICSLGWLKVQSDYTSMENAILSMPNADRKTKELLRLRSNTPLSYKLEFEGKAQMASYLPGITPIKLNTLHVLHTHNLGDLATSSRKGLSASIVTNRGPLEDYISSLSVADKTDAKTFSGQQIVLSGKQSIRTSSLLYLHDHYACLKAFRILGLRLFDCDYFDTGLAYARIFKYDVIPSMPTTFNGLMPHTSIEHAFSEMCIGASRTYASGKDANLVFLVGEFLNNDSYERGAIDHIRDSLLAMSPTITGLKKFFRATSESSLMSKIADQFLASANFGALLKNAKKMAPVDRYSLMYSAFRREVIFVRYMASHNVAALLERLDDTYDMDTGRVFTDLTAITDLRHLISYGEELSTYTTDLLQSIFPQSP